MAASARGPQRRLRVSAGSLPRCAPGEKRSSGCSERVADGSRGTAPRPQEELESAPHRRSPPTSASGALWGMRSAIVAPLAARGRAFGALTLATEPGGRCFDDAGPRARGGAGPPLCRRDRQRAPVLRTGPCSSHAAAEPAAGRAARHPRHRRGGTVSPQRRGQRGGRRLLRPLRDRGTRLDGGDGRRVRQGTRRRRRHGSRALHAAGSRNARTAAEPKPRAAQRSAPAPARRPPLLHRRLRPPRALGPGGPGSCAVGGHPSPSSCAATAKWSPWACRAA